MSEIPDHFMIVNEDGSPRGMVKRDLVLSDAVRLMYALGATAGDDAETDRVAAESLARIGVESFGYVAAAALTMTVKNVVGPLLEVLAEVAPGVDFRAKLSEVRDHAERTVGGEDQ